MIDFSFKHTDLRRKGKEMNNTKTYPLGLVGGDNYRQLVDLLERLCTGEPVGTVEDEMFAGGMLKYALFDNQCCEGSHFDSLLSDFGYEKKGGVHV